MDKQTLLGRIDEVREAWQRTIDGLGPQGLERPGAEGDWRVRDVIAHFNGWERWQVVQVRCAFTGEEPSDQELMGGIDYPEAESLQEDAMNAMFIAGTKDIPTEEILRHWREVGDMRRAWIEAAPPERLDEIIGADWSGGNARIMRLRSEVPDVDNPEPVWARFLDQIEHQNAHLERVRGWMGA